MRNLLLLIPAMLVALCGCTKSEVTEADAAKVKADFSKESYEEAMRKSGQGKELDALRAQEAARNTSGGQ